ncbi:hypothetical protein ESY86_05820 [Subsaximicrobium wynnwilliamsii]|uniref:T9SS C-terminal target domain-containing protein n=1 Tax=Subsaximicrobium wynnwilliamsii TaxID=291179 RepID=A0A5C6ZJA3_9FLAO|nr:hypothetical protein [Subsaximicrobium wynnwilliamsii]TXD84572.1 hypothetical protein ESY87_05595 [Subsaximicrobium wynnwilliamsii]TXD90254.1 hypothetical protein ESY86_05820 [Subsaximicrobium wynnwilliamsii]TXE04305.1 hypothetical protein ESY88_05590 [Subsaximicrobium wynnwilliamsii]
MKQKLLFLTLFVLSTFTFAQSPEGFTYQAVVRNSADELTSNANIGMRLSILQGTETGTSVYTETQLTSSNSNGLISLIIGNGTVVSGSMSAIDWSNGPYFIKTETDPTGGNNYTIVGVSQMLSVPYALYAANSATGAEGPQGPAGPIAGTNTQITFNNEGNAAGSANLTWDDATNTHSVNGTSITTNGKVTGLAGTGTRPVAVDENGNFVIGSATGGSGISGTGNNNFHLKWTTAGAVAGNSMIQDNGTAVAVNSSPNQKYLMYVYKNQLTNEGDGQHSLIGWRTRNSPNEGTGYSLTKTNTGTAGNSFWGDKYSFGVGGWNFNDFTRTGGVLGADNGGNYWGALGYRTSASLTYGVYGSNAYGAGAGFLPNTEISGFGGGFFGMIGSASKGSLIGQLNAGDLFSSYNSGNLYTLGKNVELVATANNKVTPVYAVTSVESTIYAKGNAKLVNGEARILFDEQFKSLLGESPEVTVTPKGNCNGVYIASIDRNGFSIKEMDNGSSNVDVSWISVGNRIDNGMDKATKKVTDPSFERNIQQVLFNDGNTDAKGQGIWWDGANIRFGNMPAHLTKVERPKGAN